MPDAVGPPGHVLPPRPWPDLYTQQQQQPAPTLQLHWCKRSSALGQLRGSQAIFEELFKWKDHTFWLDRWASLCGSLLGYCSDYYHFI